MHFTETQDIATTFIINGFQIHTISRFPNNSIFNIYKYDRLGAEIRYSILFTNDETDNPIFETLKREANNYNSHPIVVSDNLESSDKVYSKQKFFAFFGGIVNTGLILVPNLEDIMNALGHNELPIELLGKPDDLHEIYINECFQYVLKSPGIRYGKDRLFESLPDGIVLGKHQTTLLTDSKAYSKGYSVSSDDIKRFSDYVTKFNQRYATYFGPIFSFVVVAGSFNDSRETMSKRSEELYKYCNTRLAYITSSELAKIIKLIIKEHEYHQSIVWKNVFSETLITSSVVIKEIETIKKDKLL